MHEDIDRFADLRFLYACNKLDPAETAWVDAMLAAHPELAADITADRALVQASREALAYVAQTTPPLVTFNEIARALDQPAPPGWWQRLAGAIRLAWILPMPSGYAVCAMALLALVAGLQFSVPTRDAATGPVYRGTGTPVPVVPTVAVVFAETLTVGQLRSLSDELDFDIVAGPDRHGVFQLAPRTPGSAHKLAEQLKAHAAVMDAFVRTTTP